MNKKLLITLTIGVMAQSSLQTRGLGDDHFERYTEWKEKVRQNKLTPKQKLKENQLGKIFKKMWQKNNHNANGFGNSEDIQKLLLERLEQENAQLKAQLAATTAVATEATVAAEEATQQAEAVTEAAQEAVAEIAAEPVTLESLLKAGLVKEATESTEGPLGGEIWTRQPAWTNKTNGGNNE